MSELPENWAGTTLGEVAEIVRGVTYKKEQAKSEPQQGLVPLLRATNISQNLNFDGLVYVPNSCVSESQRLKQGDIVIAASSGSKSVVGKAALLNTDWSGTFGAFCAVVRPAQKVAPKYLGYYLQTSEYRNYVSERSSGVNINNLKAGDLEAFRMRIAPREEQDRIVAEIEKQFTLLDAATAALKRVQANLKRYRASVLKAACEGRLVPTEAELARKEGRDYEPADQLLQRILRERRARWEADTLAKMIASGKLPKDNRWKQKYKEPAAPAITNLPTLPDGWCWASVEEISAKVVDGVHKKPNYVPNGIPFITVRNLTAGPGISFEQTSFVTSEDHAEFIKRANPEPGDILVSKDGTLGTIRAVRTDREFSIFVSVAMIKPVLRDMTDFLEIALMAPQVQAQMVPKGSGLQHIHLEDLREDCVPLPPLAEQTRIVDDCSRRMSLLDKFATDLPHVFNRAASLRSSVLQGAFTGTLVCQDPSDEPASVLLERICAERHSPTVRRPPRLRREEPAHA